MIKKEFLIIIFLFTSSLSISQNDTNQNGLKSTVITGLTAAETQAKRYEIAVVGYNSFHWQTGGVIIIELFQISYGTGYEKYVLENGFRQGANSGSASLKLVESQGMFHTGKITLGTPADLTSSLGSQINRKLPIYFDVRDYANYKIKISYLQERVDEVTYANQIQVNQSPSSVSIPDFSVSTALDQTLTLTGYGNNSHYILNGNVGLGTTAPDEKLTVKGKIHTQEVRVDMAGPLVPDYVFENDYKLKTLQEVEDYIKENKHLPEVASAKEIEKNGLMLAEMNMTLLKKVEELTLYLIEMKKENDNIRKENIKQNAEIKSLKSYIYSK